MLGHVRVDVHASRRVVIGYASHAPRGLSSKGIRNIYNLFRDVRSPTIEILTEKEKRLREEEAFGALNGEGWKAKVAGR